MNTLIGYDLVPEAKIIDSALRACRRLNDLASAIRILEAVKVRGSPFIASSATALLPEDYILWCRNAPSDTCQVK